MTLSFLLMPAVPAAASVDEMRLHHDSQTLSSKKFMRVLSVDVVGASNSGSTDMCLGMISDQLELVAMPID
jgi:hypothetical protein